jgi:hypothetical protein
MYESLKSDSKLGGLDDKGNCVDQLKIQMDLRPLYFANLPMAAAIGLLASRAHWLFPTLAVAVGTKCHFRSFRFSVIVLSSNSSADV